MKLSGPILTLVSVVVATSGSLTEAPATSQESCLDAAVLIQRDGQWERALLESDAELLDAFVADEFVWVHNHASGIDDKERLLERLSGPSAGGANATRSRVSSDVEVRVLGATGVVTGFTVVDRGPRPIRYNFMRTYVELDGRCVLLANHTMEVPANDE